MTSLARSALLLVFLVLSSWGAVATRDLQQRTGMQLDFSTARVLPSPVPSPKIVYNPDFTINRPNPSPRPSPRPTPSPVITRDDPVPDFSKEVRAGLLPADYEFRILNDDDGASCPTQPGCSKVLGCTCPEPTYLELPPFLPDDEGDDTEAIDFAKLELSSGPADSFFDVFFDIFPDGLAQLGRSANLRSLDLSPARSPAETLLSLTRPWPFPYLPWPNNGLVFNGVTDHWSEWKRLCIRIAQQPVDVLFLADTTGSMGPYLTAVKSNAVNMFNTLSGALTNLKVGVAAYKDQGDVYAYNLFSPISSMSAGLFNANVNTAWNPSGGGDWPEAQLYALASAASSASTGWRNNSIKIVVWFGDAPGHDPTVGGVTLSAAKNALLSKGIKVIALDCASLNNAPYQASYLASQTGGWYGAVSSSSIAATMISSIANINVVLKPVVQCPLNVPFIIEFDPEVAVGTPSRPACFNVRVKACNAEECAPPGRYVCNVTFYDTTNGQVVDMRPLVINTVAGADVTPPWFLNVPPSPVVLECPADYKCPTLRLMDNCDAPVSVSATEGPWVGSQCSKTKTCRWEGKDAAGNSAVAVQQSITVVDSTPPAMSSICASRAICLREDRMCFNPRTLVRSCFKDACNEIVDSHVQCMGCYGASPDGTPYSMDCSTNADGTMCIAFDPKQGPRCCAMMVTVTDACGNVQSSHVKVCYAPPGSANPIFQCLPSSYYM